MDKSWIGLPRSSPQYMVGLNRFLDFAFARRSVRGMIACPCEKCKFTDWQTREKVFEHCLKKQFPRNYLYWIHHGEGDDCLEVGSSSQVGMRVDDESEEDQNDAEAQPILNSLLRDSFGGQVDRGDGDEAVEGPEPAYLQNEAARTFFELMKEGDIPLNPGNERYSKLSFLTEMYAMKCKYGGSDALMSAWLGLLSRGFYNIDAQVPSSFYEAKKTITKMGCKYIKIDACRYDCMLFWEGDDQLEKCKRCNTDRYLPKSESRWAKKRAVKSMRYFPLRPRLQRLFMCEKMAKHMSWHGIEPSIDAKMRHPRDGDAWKAFDRTFPRFAREHRNVRLGLTSDGFNPFGACNQAYSIWPVVLIPYNLPPWMCMDPNTLILSTIIPGPTSPGNDIDVYLQPLMKELKELWGDGVETYDAHQKEIFTLRAALMWTVSDFPGLGTLSGWNTHTGLACPYCNFDQEAHRLPYSKKSCFMGHRRFLPRDHRYRRQKNKFNGQRENRGPPIPISGSEIFEQVRHVECEFGKDPPPPEEEQPPTRRAQRIRRPAPRNTGPAPQWKKKSIFFDLPYWKDNQLRHCLDVMHIEKNVGENFLYTIMNEGKKSKDHLGARKDLQAMGIRREAWPDENDKFAPAKFTLTKTNKELFLRTLKSIKVPDGYSSNIERRVDLVGKKISGLKSHDYHVLLQQFLPLAAKHTLPADVSIVLADISYILRQLCAKVLDRAELDILQEKVVTTLCHLEMIFPPSFFTSQVHLIVHLVHEAKMGGPVHYRWMYPIERL